MPMDPSMLGALSPDPSALPPGLPGPPGTGGEFPAGPPPAPGGFPPELAAALAPGQNSTDLLAEGPMAGEETAAAEEPAGGDDPLSMVREAISLLRRAGEIEPDDQRSHLIDKVQTDLQKILASESQKTDKLRAALG